MDKNELFRFRFFFQNSGWTGSVAVARIGRRVALQPVRDERRVRQLADAGPAGTGTGRSAADAARLQSAARVRHPPLRLRTFHALPTNGVADRSAVIFAVIIVVFVVVAAGRRRRRRTVRPQRRAHQFRQGLGSQIFTPVHHLLPLLDRSAPGSTA